MLLVSVAGFAAGPSADLRLVDAVKRQDKQAVQSLLRERVDVNARQGDGATALAWAADRNDVETVDLLLRAGADANAANEYGVTPLSLACTHGNTAMVERLLRAGANPNVARLTGETSLMTCSRVGAVEAVKLLLARGADVNAKDAERGQTALMWAASQKHPDVVQALVDAKADVHVRSAALPLYKPTRPITYSPNVHFPETKGGFTALLFAAQVGDLESVRILLAAGARVNDATSEAGSALVLAAMNGHEKLALFLLEQGADPSITDGYGITPLHWAVQEGLKAMYGRPGEVDPYWEHPNMPELVKALLVRGANPNARIKKDFDPYIHRFARNRPIDLPAAWLTGATPFVLAAASGDSGMMRLLLEGKAQPNLATAQGLTPLMVAAGVGVDRVAGGTAGLAPAVIEGKIFPSEEEKKYLEAIKVAVEHGADVNAPGPGGRTALHGAVLWGQLQTIQYLAEKGADLEARDMYGQSALSIALGDPGHFVYRQLPDDDFDVSFRRSKSRKEAVDLLLKLGAKPYDGPMTGRAGR
jgi:ankyrin repeat protein